MDALGKAIVKTDTVSAISYIVVKLVSYRHVHCFVEQQKDGASAIL